MTPPTFAEFMASLFGACIDHRHKQVGRCVYCADCNRRLYQGQVMSAAELADAREAITQSERKEMQVSNGWDDEAQPSGGFNWDDEDVQPTGGEFVKFPNVGDQVIGTITAIRKQRFDDGDGVQYAPQLDLQLPDGSEATLTAGQWHLKRLLIEARPNVGDMIRVIHTGKQGRSKLFTLDVRAGKAAAPAKAAKAARPPAKRASAPPVDDWSNGAAADDGIPF